MTKVSNLEHVNERPPVNTLKTIFLCSFLLASLAHAQSESTSTLSTQQLNHPLPSQTSTQNITDAAEEAAGKSKNHFLAEFWDESSFGVQATKERGTGAGIASQYTIGLGYKVTSKLALGIQQIAFSRSNFNDMGDSDVEVFQNGDKAIEPHQQVLGDFALKSVYNSNFQIFGSEPLNVTGRYYFGSSPSAKALGRTGYLRLDLGPSWVLNPRFNFDFTFSPRVIFYNELSKYGRDAVDRLVSGPVLTYNFNDHINAYSSTTVDLNSTEAQRGRANFDVANLLNPEVGLNFIIGDITINPAITSYVNLSSNEANLFTSESRIFAADNSSYLLNVYANF